MVSPAALYRDLVPLPSDLLPEKRAVLRRIEARVWPAVLLTLLVAWVTHSLIGRSARGRAAVGAHLAASLGPGLPATVLLLRFAFARSAEHGRQETRLRDAVARTARLDGAMLVARTAAHRINNALGPVVGYAELLTLTTGGSSEPQVRAHAQRILAAAEQAAAEVALLQRIVRLEEDPTSTIALLDLEASTATGAGDTDDTDGDGSVTLSARQRTQRTQRTQQALLVGTGPGAGRRSGARTSRR